MKLLFFSGPHIFMQRFFTKKKKFLFLPKPSYTLWYIEPFTFIFFFCWMKEKKSSWQEINNFDWFIEEKFQVRKYFDFQKKSFKVLMFTKQNIKMFGEKVELQKLRVNRPDTWKIVKKPEFTQKFLKFENKFGVQSSKNLQNKTISFSFEQDFSFYTKRSRNNSFWTGNLSRSACR